MTSYEIGAWVRTRAQRRGGHTRLPGYLQQHQGVIERILGEFPLADERAAGNADARKQTLYTVRFAAHEVWQSAPNGDALRADLFEDYLEPAE